MSTLEQADEKELADRQVSREEAERQLALLRRPPQYATLVRPCVLDDGIEPVPDGAVAELHAFHEQAARAGRLVKFVPASGAATRMFRELHRFHSGAFAGTEWNDAERWAEGGHAEARVLVSFLREVQRFPFYRELRATMDQRGADLDASASRGDFRPVLSALLDPDGMDYQRQPKGLLRFHSYQGSSRTAFEEHLVEAVHFLRDESGLCRLHFTVSPEHRDGFEACFRTIEADFVRRYDAHFQVDYSVQDPSTDTLAVDERDDPLRDADGRLMFRPGGHGALIHNLNDLGGDIVFIKNIDNVQPDRLKRHTVDSKRALAGYLVQLQRRVFHYLSRIREPDPPPGLLDEVHAFACKRLFVERPAAAGPNSFQAQRAWLIDRLNRPIRICGVVRNTGEPGGGPFWVRDTDGATSLQIVESAQVNPEDDEQQRILGKSTHFNPVDLVCAVRDAAGRPFDLARFVDPNAAIVTRKSEAGRDIKALERPGLWNGGMAGWNTVFVEVPLETFTPVKSVIDLLRAEHQPG